MEMKAPTTTAQPQPPSGGVYPTGPPTAGGMSAHEGEEEDDEVSGRAGFRGEDKSGPGALGSGFKTCERNRAET